jgi:hypothetical protein
LAKWSARKIITRASADTPWATRNGAGTTRDATFAGSEAARQWLDENVVSEPWQWVQGALCAEPRFARDLLVEVEAAGFEIGS